MNESNNKYFKGAKGKVVCIEMEDKRRFIPNIEYQKVVACLKLFDRGDGENSCFCDKTFNPDIKDHTEACIVATALLKQKIV